MLIYGLNPVREAINSGRKVYELYHVQGTHGDLVDYAHKQGIKTTLMDKQALKKKFGPTHQSIAANVAEYETVSLKTVMNKPGRKVFLLLDGIEDPHNLGAIIRNAEAFAASGIIIPKNRSAGITPTVVKISAGAIEYVDIIESNINQAIKTLKDNNVWVVGFDVDTDQSLDDVFADTDLALVFGNEGTGMSALVSKNCDFVVKIPMDGTINSLNVSVSTGVALHDIKKRQRG